MIICFNCGQESGDDTEICLNCGNRLSGGAPVDQPIGPPPAAAKPTPKPPQPTAAKKQAAPPPSSGAKKAPAKGDDKKAPAVKKKASEKPPSDEKPEQPSLAGVTFHEVYSKNRDKARAILIIGVLMLIPGIMLPWFYFFENRPIEAFNLPVMFLFTGAPLFPKVTAGLVLCVLFVVAFLSSIFRKSVITFAQFSAFIVFLICIGGLLTNVRMWNAMEGLGGRYPTFAYDQISQLSDHGVFGPVVTKELSPSDRIVGASSKSGFSFLLKTAGPGLLFPLLASFIILWSTIKYAPFFNSFNFSAPMALTSVIAVLFIFAFGFFIISKAAPAWWYGTQAKFLTQTGKDSAAIKKLELCAELPIKSGTCEVKLAGLYLKTGRKTEAKELLIKAAREIPYYPELRTSLGDMYFAEKDFPQAAKQYKKYLESRPSDIKYRNRLSDALVVVSDEYYSANNFSKALEGYKEAESQLEQNKTDMPLQFKIADCYYRLGMKKESAVHYQRISDNKKLDFEAHIQAGRVFEEIEDYDKAIEYYKKAIEVKNDHSFSYVYIGDIYLAKLNDEAKAVEWYNKAIEANLYNTGADAARDRLEALGEKPRKQSK